MPSGKSLEGDASVHANKEHFVIDLQSNPCQPMICDRRDGLLALGRVSQRGSKRFVLGNLRHRVCVRWEVLCGDMVL